MATHQRTWYNAKPLSAHSAVTHASGPCCMPPADERVQLERLRDELLGHGGHPQRTASQALRVPLPLGLTDSEQQVLEAYRHKVDAWGWRWQAGSCSGKHGSSAGGSSSGGSSGGPLLTHVPLLWGTALTATDLKVRPPHVTWRTC